MTNLYRKPVKFNVGFGQDHGSLDLRVKNGPTGLATVPFLPVFPAETRRFR
jgi:hypothetical protein